MAITLTEKAACEIQRVMQDQKCEEDVHVRVGVTGGGCSGFSYSLSFDNKYDEKSPRDRSCNEIIAAIRSALSLQLSDLAEILGTERPTVYSWITGVAAPSENDESRLREVFRLAGHWNRISSQPLGEAVRQIGPREQSILDALKQEAIPVDDVLSRFHAVVEARQKESETAGRNRQSVRERAAQYGIDLSRVKEQQHVLDVLTGKRSHQD